MEARAEPSGCGGSWTRFSTAPLWSGLKSTEVTVLPSEQDGCPEPGVPAKARVSPGVRSRVRAGPRRVLRGSGDTGQRPSLNSLHLDVRLHVTLSYPQPWGPCYASACRHLGALPALEGKGGIENTECPVKFEFQIDNKYCFGTRISNTGAPLRITRLGI